MKAAQSQLDTADADLKLLEQKQSARYSKPEVAAWTRRRRKLKPHMRPLRMS